MQVTAKHNIVYGDKRISGGETFEVSKAEYEKLRPYVEKVEYVSDVFPPDQPVAKPVAKRSKKKE